MSVVVAFIHAVRVSFRSRAVLQAEIIALRHQLHVLQRSRPRPRRLACADRTLWVWLLRAWPGWRARNGRRLASARLSTVLDMEVAASCRPPGRVSRDPVADSTGVESQSVVAPRIHGEVLKLGIDVSQGPWRNTCRVDDGRRHHTGGRFSPRISRRSSPPTSSSCQR